jgi:cytochrome c
MAGSGVTWDEETIAKYVKEPKEFIAGNKMAFVGIKKEDEIEDLLAFIQAKCCS